MPIEFNHDLTVDLRDVLTGDACHLAAALVGFADAGLIQDHDDLVRYADDEPTLVARDYWVDYAKDLAEDTGSVPREDANWPLRYIDWPAAAAALEEDYESVTIAGREYLIRTI